MQNICWFSGDQWICVSSGLWNRKWIPVPVSLIPWSSNWLTIQLSTLPLGSQELARWSKHLLERWTTSSWQWRTYWNLLWKLLREYVIPSFHAFNLSLLLWLINLMLFTEGTSASSPTENTLPVVFDATEDPNLNNLTRSDVNCDKTGTCYDGKFLIYF